MKTNKQMTDTELKEIEVFIKKIKEEWGDWEGTHCDYDNIVEIIARHYEPKLMKRLDRLMKNASWWSA